MVIVIIYVKDGKYFIGGFKNGCRYGAGRLYNADGIILEEGNYVNDKFDGIGKIYLNNGKYFLGMFKNGLKHGKGMLCDKEGKQLIVGEFVNGEPKINY